MQAGRPRGRLMGRPAFARDTQRVSVLAVQRFLPRCSALGRETDIGPAFAGRGRSSSPMMLSAGIHSACRGYIPARGGGRLAAGRSDVLPGADRPFFDSIFPMTCRGANAPVLFQSRKQSLHNGFERFKRHVVTHQFISTPRIMVVEPSKMSEIRRSKLLNTQREKAMNASTESYRLLREIAGMPVTPVGDAIQRVVSRLAPHVHMSVSRAKSVWYGEARLIRAEEIDALRLAAAEQRRKLEAGRAQVRHIAELYRAAAERLRALDPAFHSFEITRLEQQADQICPLDRPGTAGASPVDG